MVSDDPIFKKLKDSLDKSRATATIKDRIEDSIDRVLSMIQALTENKITAIKITNREE